MNEILIFAGTTEGRTLAERLLDAGRLVHICVATEYGEEVLFKHDHLTIHRGRLSCDEMEQLIRRTPWEMVIDATHPYAVEVSKNIKQACSRTNQEYVRFLRKQETVRHDAHIRYVDSIEEVAAYLNQTEGNILLTTGSKELPSYLAQLNDLSRVYARILADAPTVEKCHELGLHGKQIICMQGPFSTELNAAMLKQVQAAYLVTKDTGAAGGFLEKIEGAKQAGAKVLVIRRPVKESGYDLEELLEHLGIPVEREPAHVTLLGIGMGSLADLTLEGKQACENADAILGASRMTEALKCFGKESEAIYLPEQILAYLKLHPEKQRIVVAFSGDIGFYSGTKRLLTALKELPVTVELIPGISSVAAFAARLHIAWEDLKLVSVHGRSQNLIGAVRAHEKVFTLAGYAESVRSIAGALIKNGFLEVRVSVGCQLGYENESVTTGTPQELASFSQEGLCVLVIENPSAKDHVVTHGLADSTFERGNAPMTKEEIRSISLSKLSLTASAVIYDVGAGTGSIGLECALQAADGFVYAIEKKTDALELLAVNQKRLGVTNFEIVAGTAPEAFAALPVPTHAFIGGSSGNLKEIVSALQEKNPSVRIVINCIALETLTEVLQLCREQSFAVCEIVQVFVGRSKTLGSYHMMMGQNPVYIITLQG